MAWRSELILLLDHQPPVTSACAQALAALGYTRVRYQDYLRSSSVVGTGEVVHAIVAAWTDRTIDRDTFLTAVDGATDRPHVRGALVVSPFSTPRNAQMLQRCGAKAWIRFPFSVAEFDSRLRFLLEGERRRRVEPVAIDWRREPVFPLVAPA